MKVLIDADGCPVVNEVIKISKQFDLDVLLLCDTAHVFHREDVEVLVFSKGRDSVDFALVNRVSKGDIVVTQDYGLAAMVLAKGGYTISQNGMLYTTENIDQLLFARAASKKARDAGVRLKGPSKRKKEDNEAFEIAFYELCQTVIGST